MITYAPFFRTMKERNMSSYRLITYHQISRSMYDRIKHNKPLTTTTIDTLCKILNCRVEDILVYSPDEGPHDNDQSNNYN